jgi:hypothetical protein
VAGFLQRIARNGMRFVPLAPRPRHQLPLISLEVDRMVPAAAAQPAQQDAGPGPPLASSHAPLPREPLPHESLPREPLSGEPAAMRSHPAAHPRRSAPAMMQHGPATDQTAASLSLPPPAGFDPQAQEQPAAGEHDASTPAHPAPPLPSRPPAPSRQLQTTTFVVPRSLASRKNSRLAPAPATAPPAEGSEGLSHAAVSARHEESEPSPGIMVERAVAAARPEAAAATPAAPLRVELAAAARGAGQAPQRSPDLPATPSAAAPRSPDASKTAREANPHAEALRTPANRSPASSAERAAAAPAARREAAGARLTVNHLNVQVVNEEHGARKQAPAREKEKPPAPSSPDDWGRWERRHMRIT